MTLLFSFVAGYLFGRWDAKHGWRIGYRFGISTRNTLRRANYDRPHKNT